MQKGRDKSLLCTMRLLLSFTLAFSLLCGVLCHVLVDKGLRRHAFKRIELKHKDKLKVCGHGLADITHFSLSNGRPWWNEPSNVLLRLDVDNNKLEHTIVEMNANALPGKEDNKTRASSVVSPYIIIEDRFCLEFNLEESGVIRIYYPTDMIGANNSVPYDYLSFERLASLNHLFVQGARSVYATLNGQPVHKYTGDQMEKFDHHLIYNLGSRGDGVLEYDLTICLKGVLEQNIRKIFVRLLPALPSEGRTTTNLYFLNDFEAGYGYSDYTMNGVHQGFFSSEVSEANGGQKHMEEAIEYDNNFCMILWIVDPDGSPKLNVNFEDNHHPFAVPLDVVPTERPLRYLKIDGIPMDSVTVKDYLGLIGGEELSNESPKYYEDRNY